jgi:hypothetical protein
MVPYSATDLLRVMQYEMTPEPARTYGDRLITDASPDNRDDDRNDKGGGALIRFLLLRAAPSPTAA